MVVVVVIEPTLKVSRKASGNMNKDDCTVMHDHIYTLASAVCDLCRSSSVCLGRLGVSGRETHDRKQSWLFPGRFEVS